MHKIDDWKGCYPSNWKGLIVPEAMSHPAKYSNRLIRRIYEHAREEGWVEAGDRVIDPFGGVALGGLDAMRIGLHWTGVELEAKFVGLGSENIDFWNKKFSRMPNWGTARLLQGDSRKLLEVIGEKSAVMSVSSPPYADSLNANESANDSEARVQRKLAAGVDMNQSRNRGGPNSVLNQPQVYGDSDGQLGAMPDEGFDLALSSPPFLQSSGGANVPKGMDPALMVRHAAGNKGSHAYGTSDGQLSSMGDEGFDLALSSPPYAETRFDGGLSARENGYGGLAPYSGEKADTWRTKRNQENLGNMPTDGKDFDLAVSSPPYEGTRLAETGDPMDSMRRSREEKYGSAYEESMSGDSFWLAARAIVDQVFCALRPGGHAIWVVKGYVKNKRYIDFPDQWRQLCEAAGFVTLHEHHALLVHSRSYTLEGETVEKKSASFFRRIAEKKGSPKIEHETVWCMVRP